MLRISKITDYGIVLLTELARGASDEPHNARALAETAQLPLPIVSKTLKALTRRGLWRYLRSFLVALLARLVRGAVLLSRRRAAPPGAVPAAADRTPPPRLHPGATGAAAPPTASRCGSVVSGRARSRLSSRRSNQYSQPRCKRHTQRRNTTWTWCFVPAGTTKGSRSALGAAYSLN